MISLTPTAIWLAKQPPCMFSPTWYMTSDNILPKGWVITLVCDTLLPIALFILATIGPLAQDQLISGVLIGIASVQTVILLMGISVLVKKAKD
jgi:hypothetical protein